MKKLLLIFALSALTAPVFAMDRQELKRRPKHVLIQQDDDWSTVSNRTNTTFMQFPTTDTATRNNRVKNYLENDLNRELPQYWHEDKLDPEELFSALKKSCLLTACVAVSCGLLEFYKQNQNLPK